MKCECVDIFINDSYLIYWLCITLVENVLLGCEGVCYFNADSIRSSNMGRKHEFYTLQKSWVR